VIPSFNININNNNNNNNSYSGGGDSTLHSLDSLGSAMEKFFDLRIISLNSEFDSVVQLKFQQGCGDSESQVISARTEAKKLVNDCHKLVSKAIQQVREVRAASVVATSSALTQAELNVKVAEEDRDKAMIRLDMITKT
jgi:hypothetical protein